MNSNFFFRDYTLPDANFVSKKSAYLFKKIMFRKIDEIELKNKIEKAMENCLTMAGVARLIGIDYKTLKHYAIKFNLFKPNPSGKGCYNKSIEDMISGKITIGKSILKQRLIDGGYLDYKCKCCGIDSWNNNAITLELDHIDGNKKNNNINNLRLLCPNCHSQTITYRNKNNNIPLNKETVETEINNSSSQNQLCKRLGIANRGKETRIRIEKILGYQLRFNKLKMPL